MKEVQSLMGFVNYYRKLTFKLSEAAYPLNQLLKKKKKWEWGQKKEESFQQIIKNVSEESKVRFYDPKLSLTIETDALDHITETTLLQEGEPIAFMSKIMNQAEQNYGVTEKEMLVIIQAVKKWRKYLEET